MIKAIQFIILCFPLIEAPIEALLEKYRPQWVERNDKWFHFWTAVARGVLMIGIAITFHVLGIVLWWQALVLMVALHFAFFNYLYNALTGRRWNYLRDKGIDGALKILPSWGLAFFQWIILMTGLMVYYQIWGFKL